VLYRFVVKSTEFRLREQITGSRINFSQIFASLLSLSFVRPNQVVIRNLMYVGHAIMKVDNIQYSSH